MRGLLVATSCLVMFGCASTGPVGEGRGDPRLISREQALNTGAETVYDAVHRLRHEWLSGRGYLGGIPPLVFRDYLKMGGIEAMKSMSLEGIHSIEWLQLDEAYSVLLGAPLNERASGVIVVWTKPPERR